MLLSAALLLPPSSSAQYVVVGQACGASGLSAIANDGTPVVCRGNPLVWTAIGGGGGTADPPVTQNYTLTATGAQAAINLTAAPIDTHTISWRLGSNGLPTSITDTIPYANGDLHTANANWVYQAGTFTVSSNQVFGQATTALAYRSDGPNTGGEWAQTTVVNGGANNAQAAGPCVRVATGASNAYCLLFTSQSTNVFRLFLLSAGVLQPALGTYDSQVPSTGDVIKIVANGSTISAYKNGICLQPCGVVDTTLTTGETGIYSNANATVNGISNFQSGTIISCNVQLDSSPDGTNFTAGGMISSQPCVALNGSASSGSVQVSGIANYVRANVTALTAGQTLQVVYSGRLAPAGANSSSTPVSNGQYVQPGQVIWFQYTSQAGLAAAGAHASANILSAAGQITTTNIDGTGCIPGAAGFGFAVTSPGWLQSATTYVTSAGYPQGSVYINIYILNGMPQGGNSLTCTGNLSTTQIGALLAGMPTGSFFPVSFVGTTAVLSGPWSIPGYTAVLSPTTPAAGAEWTITLANQARTCIQSISFTVAAGSTNITPALQLKFQNNAGGNVQTLTYSAATAQTSATTQIYSFSPGSTELVTGQASPNTIHIVPFNNGAMVCANAAMTVTVGSLTNGLNGTTAYTNIAILTQVQQDNN